MAKKMYMLGLVASLILFTSPAAADMDVQEGLWEITTVTAMSGTAIQMPPQKHTQCFSGEDLVPKNPKAPQSCVIKEKRSEGNTLNWVMECSSSNVKTVATGRVTYDGDSFSGETEISVGGSEVKLVSTLSGRRLGPCK